MPTLFLICGLPGSGKTTLARRLERERPALRLSPDEWMEPLWGPEAASRLDSARGSIEAIQWSVAARALELGLDVALEYGFWSRREREDYRARALALGAEVRTIFLEVPLEELWSRLQERNAKLPPGSFRVERAQLEEWWGWFEPPSPEELSG